MAIPLRQQIIDQIRLMMGGQMVDIELDPEHYENAMTLAFDRYRQRAGNSTEESYYFLHILYETNQYTLPEEIVQVRGIYRRGLGETQGGTYLDPFSLAYTNLYLLQAGAGGGYTAGLLTYELFNEYLKQAGRMFGAYINYTYNPVTKLLTLIRKPTGGETVVLWCQRIRVDEELLQDPFVRPWIRSYALTWCKTQLGEAYSKFNSYVGPGGGTTLKGDALKQEAVAEREVLEKELDNYIDASNPPLIVIG